MWFEMRGGEMKKSRFFVVLLIQVLEQWFLTSGAFTPVARDDIPGVREASILKTGNWSIH